jgi:effector-binding domain-containing protein
VTEQQPYRVVQRFDDFELRRYPEHLLAEVITSGSFEGAGNQAFRTLFAYITGQNRSSQKVAMTAPVVQADASHSAQKIAMTAPVLQQAGAEPGGGKFRVAFVLPQGMTAESAPQPINPDVILRTVPASLVAAIRFSGRWSESSYQRHLERLTIALGTAGFTAVGPPRYARFDPPFKPWFLRRNEVLLDASRSR